MKVLSIVLSFRNEEKNIPELIKRLTETLKKLSDWEYQLIFVNDDSTDNSEQILLEKQKIFPIKIINMSRRFGNLPCVLAGLKNATGDAIFMIDVDCQDPPEMLIDFLKKYEEGYEIVYGKRDRSNESMFLYVGSKIFYRLTKVLADNSFIVDMGEFLLFSSKIKNEIIKVNTDKPFIRSEISAAGFKKFGIDYKRETRKHGKSHYSHSFFKLFSYALTGFISSSTFFLRFSALVGFFVIVLDLILLFLNLFINFINFQYFFSLNLIFIIFVLASNSIYIARTHNNLLQRSKYIIDEKKSKNIKEII